MVPLQTTKATPRTPDTGRTATSPTKPAGLITIVISPNQRSQQRSRKNAEQNRAPSQERTNRRQKFQITAPHRFPRNLKLAHHSRYLVHIIQQRPLRLRPRPGCNESGDRFLPDSRPSTDTFVARSKSEHRFPAKNNRSTNSVSSPTTKSASSPFRVQLNGVGASSLICFLPKTFLPASRTIQRIT